ARAARGAPATGAAEGLLRSLGSPDDILSDKRVEVARRKAEAPRAALERRCAGLTAPRDFEGALRPARGAVRLIAEVKKASPSRGVLVPGLDPPALALAYAAAGRPGLC